MTEPRFRNSKEWALWWEARNRSRVRDLNDALDACKSLLERRALFQTLSEEEQRGIMPELCRRAADRQCPVGSMVRPRDERCSLRVRSQDDEEGYPRIFTHASSATVIGQGPHGSYVRYLMLHVPWTSPSGQRIVFAEAFAGELTEVGDA